MIPVPEKYIAFRTSGAGVIHWGLCFFLNAAATLLSAIRTPIKSLAPFTAEEFGLAKFDLGMIISSY